MIRYLYTKIKNKYKLYLCLICGMVSMIMVFSMIQMFRCGSLNKVIQSGFVGQAQVTEEYPATISGRMELKAADFRDAAAKGQSAGEFTDQSLDEYMGAWEKKMHLPVIADQRKIVFVNVQSEYSYRGEKMVDLGCMDDGLNENAMQDHYVVEAGADFYGDISDYIDRGAAIPDGAYPCLVSRKTADDYDLVVGEVISFPLLFYHEDPNYPNPPILSVYINGIISEKPGDYYWQTPLTEGNPFLMLKKQDFYKIAEDYIRLVTCECTQALDYRLIDRKNAARLKKRLASLRKKDGKLTENLTPVLEKYRVESRSVEQMLYVIILPLAVLILTFIGMISFRIIDSETRELQTLKDRGMGKWKLIQTYLLSAFALSQISMPIGLLAGYGFGKLVAGVDDFMGFSAIGKISVSEYGFTPSMIAAGEIAALLSVIINLIPVLLFFKKKKDGRRAGIVPFWEKYFLDAILLLVSVYLLFNYKKQLSTLSESVMQGDGIDPVIFINASLFLFACGLVMLRLIFYCIRLFYRIGEKRFSAPVFAGLLQIIRTRKSSGVISVFMVMTVAMSLFHANMAHTINANKEARLSHVVGADINVLEKWDISIKKGFGADGMSDKKWKYREPDFGLYRNLCADGLLSQVTKVARDDTMWVSAGDNTIKNVELMGIHTKEFGQTARLREGLNEEHFYSYLNELAVEYGGAIVSSNLALELKVQVGDYIQCDMLPPKVIGQKDPYATAKVKIVGIVEAWPGYERFGYRQDEEGKTIEEESYLIVMNYAFVNSAYGLFPYEVWGKAEGEDAKIRTALKEKLAADNREMKAFVSWREELAREKESAIIQITNGLFTADFLIALLLCIIGYMIYWITAIRDRELLFGICRAMGITQKEVSRMLLMEQLFLSFMSIAAGVGAGILTSRFFAPVFAAVYLPQKHSVPVFVTGSAMDTIRLCVTLSLVVIICIIWIRRILKGLNITRALKLGED
ncbi:MAG: ABC transporter permease [Lachnospiraceae bacterium]|nr:ABC transporter permease [Lachnospiraceae bacterium]